ncbi:MAG TPA: putative ABC transporter permease [Candidatus Pullilachnospira intestinigallinarum]|nr:putative ABC transporter permease [Candidatus Pullilachnospira intestinigallinarum]
MTWIDLLWLLLVYSFWGWVMETVVGTIRRKRFVNPGFSTGPFCLVYGVAALIMTVTLQDLKGHALALFVGCMVLGTTVEWVTGKLLERFNSHKWWDYSDKRWNFDGYICLQYSLLWGLLGALIVRFFNNWLVALFHWIPGMIGEVAVVVLLCMMALDLVASSATVFHMKREIRAAREWNLKVAVWTRRFALWLMKKVRTRMEKTYPVLQEKALQIQKSGTFAEGCGFYKLFWMFFIGAVVGDLFETVYCRISMGWWMSRSSLVWGSFSLIWGGAIMLATMLLYKDRNKPDRYIFLVGTVLGGAYEYVCSVLSELVFGRVFWDYSEIPFNLGGRINLLFCFFWGIAAVAWIKWLYPFFSGLIEKIPVLWGYIITWILILFLVVDMAVSGLAMIRYDRRSRGLEPKAAWEEVMDKYFDDARMEKIYPNAKKNIGDPPVSPPGEHQI